MGEKTDINRIQRGLNCPRYYLYRKINHLLCKWNVRTLVSELKRKTPFDKMEEATNRNRRTEDKRSWRIRDLMTHTVYHTQAGSVNIT